MRNRLIMHARACVAALALGLAAGCATTTAEERRYAETIATGAAAGAVIGGVLGAITGAVVPGSDAAVQGVFIGIASGLAAGVAAGIVIADRNELFTARETRAESRQKAAEAETVAWELRAAEAEREAAASASDLLRLRELYATRRAAAGDLASALDRSRNDIAKLRAGEHDARRLATSSADAAGPTNTARLTAAAERMRRAAEELESVLAAVPPA